MPASGAWVGCISSLLPCRARRRPRARHGRSELMQPTHAPLAGIRVVELTTAWAGPMAGRVLAYLGAEVIRIEAASRPCGWRHHSETRATFRYPNNDPGERPYNRTALFN